MTTTIQRRRGRRAVAATVIAPLLALAGAGAAHADSAPMTWTFTKCASTVPGVWVGTAAGPEGTVALRTTLTSARATGAVDPSDPKGKILRVTFDWEVGDVYVADLSGILNLRTGAVVMNGTVARGDHAGSRVHEEGQQYDALHGCFAGTITVLPAT